MKTHRHTAIRDLLVKTSVAISNQDDLRRKLAAKGIHVTQATLSRDIRELKPVSYTHLDVYKRQSRSCAAVVAPRSAPAPTDYPHT